MDMRKVPERLRTSILFSIKAAEYRRARTYVAISAATLTASLVGALFASKYLIDAFYASEFYNYAALLFSDSDVALGLWKYIILSLAESLPVFAIIATLAFILIVLASVRVMINNFKMALTPSLRV